jgi:hypothetical protein
VPVYTAGHNVHAVLPRPRWRRWSASHLSPPSFRVSLVRGGRRRLGLVPPSLALPARGPCDFSPAPRSSPGAAVSPIAAVFIASPETRSVVTLKPSK